MISLLYVDDEPALLELCRVFLEREGDISVVTVHSAGEALERIKNERFDAVISDYQMPELDGITLLKKVRAASPDIPFILFTGRGREEIVIEAINSGADSYIQKGGDPRSQFKELSHRIRQIVRRRKAENELRLMKFSVDRASEGIVWLRADGSIAYCNEAICAMLGYTPEEFSGLNVVDVFRPGYRASSFAAGWQKLGERKWAVLEEILKEKDGTLLPVEMVLNYNGQGTESLVFAFVRDISERRRSEQELNLAFQRLIATEEELRQQFSDLKKSDFTVREIRQRYQLLFEESGDWIWESTPDGRITRSNAQVQDILGYSPESVVGKTLFSLIAPEDSGRFTPLLSKALAGNTAFHSLSLHMVTSKNSRVAVGISAAPVFSREGIVTGFHGIGHPVILPPVGTSRTVQEGAMAGYRTLFEAMGDAIFVTDAKTGMLLDANKKGLSLVGRTLSELRSLHESVLCPEKRGDNTREPLPEDDGREVSIFEDVLTDKSGRTLPVIVSTKTLVLGDRHIRIGIYHDISDIRAIQGVLCEKNDELDRFFRTGPDLLCILDESGQFLQLNPAGEELLGCRTGTDPAPGLFDILLPADRAAARTLIGHMGRKGKTVTFVNRVACPDGSVRWLEWRALCGGRQKIYAVARDITERRRTNEALEEASRKLHLFDDLSRHDIRNRLTVLSGYLNLFSSRPAEPYFSMYSAKISETVAAIAEQVEFFHVYQTLGIANPGWYRVDRLFVSACARSGNIPVTVENEAKDWEIFSDPLIERVFCAFVENALTHGATLTRIRCSAKEVPGGLAVCIEDNGAGIARDKKESIFMQGSGKPVANSLFMAREILAITGISVRETGQAGKGACFELFVPKGGYRAVAVLSWDECDPGRAPYFINTPHHNHTL